MISQEIRAAAKEMIDELAERKLETVLIPSPTRYWTTERKRRVNVNTNPLWYQRLCAMYPKQRSRPRRRNKPDTCIVRDHVVRALREIASGRCETLYAERLLPFCEERALGRPVSEFKTSREIATEIMLLELTR